MFPPDALLLGAMKKIALPFSAGLVFVLAVLPLAAHELLAQNEAKLLSEADRRAAAQAELQALDRDEAIKGLAWKGPDGATGLIIVSSQFPDIYGMGRCRNLVHVIRHPEDGGVNPTFEATVCRNWEGRWSVEKR